MQSFIIKVRRGDRNGLSGHTTKKIRLNKSTLQKASSPNSDRVIQVISEISDLINLNDKLGTNASKNIVKYRTNTQPRTLSQIQNFPNSNVVTSITNIQQCKVRNTSNSTSVVPSIAVNQVRTVNSAAKTSNSSIWSTPSGTSTITVGNIQPKTESTVLASRSSVPNCCVLTTKSSASVSSNSTFKSATPLVVTSQNQVKSATILTSASVQSKNNTDSQPHYTIQLKTPKNSVGSPTITSTSFTPIKPSDSKPPNSGVQRPQPIFIRKDLGAKENSTNFLSESMNDIKSDLDDDEYDDDDDDFDEKEDCSSAPIRTFCVSTGSCKTNSRPCSDSSCYNRFNKSNRVLKISTDSSRSPKINVIGKSSFVPVSILK